MRKKDIRAGIGVPAHLLRAPSGTGSGAVGKILEIALGLPLCCGEFLFENTFVVRVKLATVWRMTHELSVARRSQTTQVIDAGALESPCFLFPTDPRRFFFHIPGLTIVRQPNTLVVQ